MIDRGWNVTSMYVGNLDALPALMSLPPKHWTLGRLSEDAKSEKLKGLGLTCVRVFSWYHTVCVTGGQTQSLVGQTRRRTDVRWTPSSFVVSYTFESIR